MALGTATVGTEFGGVASRPIYFNKLSFAGDGAYPTGGTANFTEYVQAATERFVTPFYVVGRGVGGGAAYYVEYDETNDKLLVLVGATGLEVAPGDLSGVTFNVLVLSR